MCTQVEVTNGSTSPTYTSFSQKPAISPPLSPAFPIKSPLSFPPSPTPEKGQDEQDWQTWFSLPQSPLTLPPPSPPPRPLAWIWKCHLCKTKYPLGATRRCLIDGHYYCSGETGQPNLKRKSGLSCSSEFDYIGWEDTDQWKKEVKNWDKPPSSPTSATTKRRNCWSNCKFPSACRYSSVTFTGSAPKGEMEAVAASDTSSSWSPVSSSSMAMNNPTTVRNEVTASPSTVSAPNATPCNPSITFESILTSSRDTQGDPVSTQPLEPQRPYTEAKARRHGGRRAVKGEHCEKEAQGHAQTRSTVSDECRLPTLLETAVRSVERRSASLKALLSPIEEDCEANEGEKVLRGAQDQVDKSSPLMTQYILPVIEFCSARVSSLG